MTNKKAKWTQTYPKKRWTLSDKTNSNNQELASQVPLCNTQEMDSALEVIRKVMKTDAAQPFNAPVDPIALGIPDYLEVIDKPMDFGTICKNLESCVKYKNSKDVLNDVQYIWVNCSKYYKKGHYLLELTKRMKKEFTKYWTEAGLFMEQPQEMDGLASLDSMQQILRGSSNGQWGSISPYQRQDQMARSRPQPHQPQNYKGLASLDSMQQILRGNTNGQSDSVDPYKRQDQMDHSRPQPHQPRNYKGLASLDSMQQILRGSTNGQCGSAAPYQRQDQMDHSGPRPHQPQNYTFHPPMKSSYQDGLGDFHLGADPDPGRCRRTDGKKWRCSRDTLPEQKYCERHMNRGRLRSRKLVEEEDVPSPPPVGSMMRHENHGPTSSIFQPEQPPEGATRVQLSSSQPRPSHLQSCSDKEEEKLCPTAREGHVNATPKHDDQLESNQIVTPQPLMSFGQPHQPPGEALQVQLSSIQPQPPHPQAGIDKEDARLDKREVPRRRQGLDPLRKRNKKWAKFCVQTAKQQEASRNLAIERNVFTQIMGQDRIGNTQTLHVPSRSQPEVIKMVLTANAEMKEMKEKMASMEQTCAQMATQMATMMSMMSNMQKKLSDKDSVPPVSSQAADVSNDSCGLPSTSVKGVLSNQAVNVSDDAGGLPSASVQGVSSNHAVNVSDNSGGLSSNQVSDVSDDSVGIESTSVQGVSSNQAADVPDDSGGLPSAPVQGISSIQV